jgi:hypothetical protein
LAEIEITLPTVQYGNVKVRATPEEFGFKLDEPNAFGYALAIFQTVFTMGWKQGAQVDVTAPVGAAEADPVAKAQELLDEGLGGVTEVDSVRSVEEIMSDEDVDTVAEARKIQEREAASRAPWNSTVDTPKKPWETEVTAPAVLDAIGEGW